LFRKERKARFNQALIFRKSRFGRRAPSEERERAQLQEGLGKRSKGRKRCKSKGLQAQNRELAEPPPSGEKNTSARIKEAAGFCEEVQSENATSRQSVLF